MYMYVPSHYYNIDYNKIFTESGKRLKVVLPFKGHANRSTCLVGCIEYLRRFSDILAKSRFGSRR